jgi:hypothetical protein
MAYMLFPHSNTATISEIAEHHAAVSHYWALKQICSLHLIHNSWERCKQQPEKPCCVTNYRILRMQR